MLKRRTWEVERKIRADSITVSGGWPTFAICRHHHDGGCPVRRGFRRMCTTNAGTIGLLSFSGAGPQRFDKWTAYSNSARNPPTQQARLQGCFDCAGGPSGPPCYAQHDRNGFSTDNSNQSKVRIRIIESKHNY